MPFSFRVECPIGLPSINYKLDIMYPYSKNETVKNLPANAGDTRDTGSIPELGGFPGVGNSNPLQYSCLKNSMDRGAWWAAGHGVIKEWDMTEQLNHHPPLEHEI